MDRVKMAAWFKDRAENTPMPGAKAMYQATYDLLTRSQWISVKERLPDEDCTVIAVVTGWNGRYVDVVVWDSVHGEFCRHVTHWMPLPEPPEGGAENA